LSREVEEFAEQLRSKGLEVKVVNEARSSKEAFHLTGNKDRKGHIDSVAACEILKRYLNIL
jgi:RNase H-fold protein (predicted Holliday junction resolvase)